ncbi:hypothetical protein F-VV57_0247 [Faustovirus]|nr:hypothetical protein F-VV57_0247 [Faustovirus]QJX73515.1 hypothetical protein F-VV63_0249 [Faustovirus]
MPILDACIRYRYAGALKHHYATKPRICAQEWGKSRAWTVTASTTYYNMISLWPSASCFLDSKK